MSSSPKSAKSAPNKDALKSSTTNVPVPVEPPVNVDPLFKLPDWKAEADAAFKEYAAGAKAINNSEQHLAYAIMAFCASLVQTGVTGYKLSDILPARGSNTTINTAAMNFLRGKCEAEFNVVRVTKKAIKGLSFGQIEAKHNVSEERSPGMFARAFSLAYLFARDGVTYVDFDRKLGVFKVKPRLMVEGDAIDGKIAYYGRMEKAATIPIDGLSIYYVTKDAKENATPHDVNASLAHYKMCNKPEGQRRSTGGTQTQQAATTAKTKEQIEADSRKLAASVITRLPIDDASDVVSLERALQIAEYHYCQLANGPVTYRKELSTKANNFLENIMARAIRSKKEPNWETGPEVITGPTTKGTKKVA